MHGIDEHARLPEAAVYPKTHALVLFVYRVTRDYPRREWYGLVAQMRQCAVSVPANIVEGCGRATNPDFARFLHNAIGSANELRYYAELSRDLDYLTPDEAHELDLRTTEVIRMLVALSRSVHSLHR